MYLCSELTPVLYEDPSGNTSQLTANLEEISANSATLLAERELDPGCMVAMSIKDNDLYGHVEACAHDQILGWFAKVRLHKDSRWSGQRFLPEHFLAVSILEPAEVELLSKVFV